MAIKPKLGKGTLYFKANYMKRTYLQNPMEKVLDKVNIPKKVINAIDNSKNKNGKGQARIKRLLKGKNGKRFLLFNPGPVLTSDAVKSALIQYDLCHRDVEFSKLVEKLKKDCLKLFRADNDYRIIFISGSGTAALESALSSSIPEGKKVLVTSNGAFGKRLKEILDLHSIPTVYIKYKWGENINLNSLETSLGKNKDIYAIAVNHHETSVGILNPINQIGKLSKKYGKVLIVDAISSLGAENIDVKKDNIDICITSSNKCLHSVTGLSIICAKHSLLKGLSKIKPRNFYLDLYKHYKYIEEKNQTPYTPNVTSFFALEQAVSEILYRGVDYRINEYAKRNKLIKKELSRLGFNFLTNYGNESNVIVTVEVPKDINYREFYNLIKQQGFLIYDCKPPLNDKYFQIANMGELNNAMIYDLIFTIEKVLKKMRKSMRK